MMTTVGAMSIAVPVATRYLVEWYRPDLTRALIDAMVGELDKATTAMSAAGSPVSLVMTVAVPTDEVLYGVFAAESPDLVRAACERAGAVPERLSIDIDARTF
jgi:hypothetical protein